MGCCDCLARFGLISFNFIFMLSGIAVLTVGVWVKVDKDVVNMQHLVEFDSNDKALTTASTVLVIFGVGVLLIAAFGFFAACLPEKCKMGQRFFSGIYIFFLIVVFIGEFGGGITAAVFKGKIDKELPNILKKSLGPNYVEGNNLDAKAWNYIQVWLGCCGSNNAKDYVGANFTDPTQYVPNSCCVLSNHDAENPKPKDYPKCQEDAHKVQTNTTTTKDSKYLQTKGCYDKFEQEIKSHLVLLIGVGVGIAMLELLGIVLAVYVCRRKEDDDDDY
ncbi:tetraspanin-1-like [Mya arenaria]|uniref:tetraspanin-1-like n=1 Tax=Mya arenaria TaxID=6604 RepID=UPI0022E05C9E|nr:tetraspanin-1-like [Mya arenaria]